MSIEPELWVDDPPAAVAFYEHAFGARVIHRVGEGADIVARLQVRDARFWVALSSAALARFSPAAIGGSTGRTLLIVDDPDIVVEQAIAAGAVSLARVDEEHGWRLGRIQDPFGHEWEIGRPND